jgi:hypothetical protein
MSEVNFERMIEICNRFVDSNPIDFYQLFEIDKDMNLMEINKDIKNKRIRVLFHPDQIGVIPDEYKATFEKICNSIPDLVNAFSTRENRDKYDSSLAKKTEMEDETTLEDGPIITEEEIAYILCDNDLVVQNFTPNSLKLLSFNSSAINNDLEITDYIKEFNDELMHEMNEYSDAKDNNYKTLKRIKLNLLKKLFEKNKKKIITWRLGDVLSNNDQASSFNFRTQKFASRFKSNYDLKTTSALSDFNNPKFQQKPRASQDHKKMSFIGDLHSRLKKFGQPEYLTDKVGSRNSIEEHLLDGNNIEKSNPFNHIYHKFVLSVEEVKFGEAKIGYIFKFEFAPVMEISLGKFPKSKFILDIKIPLIWIVLNISKDLNMHFSLVIPFNEENSLTFIRFLLI